MTHTTVLLAAAVLHQASVYSSAPNAGALLRASDFSVRAGQHVHLSFKQQTPTGPVSLAWPHDPAWFFVRLAGTQHNRSAEQAPPSSPHRSIFTPTGPGVAMIGLDLAAAEEWWPADALAKYTTQAVSPARVRVLRSLTALVRVLREDGAAVQDHTATSKSGQQAEIRPLMDPTTIPPGGDLPVRVYTLGAGAGGARLVASHVESGERFEFAADSKGIASFTITRPGVWAIESICVEPPREPGGDWTAAIATLSFEVPAEEGARR